MRIYTWWLVLLAVLVLCSAQSPVQRRRVAVTFDDLPVATRVFNDDDAQVRITRKLLRIVGAHHVPAIGFVNEVKLVQNGRVDARRVQLLKSWIDAGLELGNHTYSHVDMNRASLEDFESETLRGDSVTRQLLAAHGRTPRWFRHPMLHTGRDIAARHRFEQFLSAHGYRVAPVTIDNYDYMYANAYELALARGDSVESRRIAVDYLDYMQRIFAYYERQSTMLFGREIPQVLLLHASALNADTFDALLRMMERRGYGFIPLEEAVRDPAYASRDEYVGPAGITWLHRWALTLGKRGSFFAGEPVVPQGIQKLLN